MSVNDDPNTRIKAADAEHFWRDPNQLSISRMAFAEERGFQALGFLRFEAGLGWVLHAHGSQTGDANVLRGYLQGYLKAHWPRDANGCVLFGVHKDGMAEVATYGRSRFDCDRLGAWGHDLLESMTAAPFQTWFGWGNEGVPKPLTEAELATLSDAGREYVLANTREAA